VKVAAMTETTHNPSAEPCWVSRLRENFTSGSYGEELETGPAARSGTAPVPYPTTVLQMDQAAPSVYVLIAIVKKRLALEASLYTLLQIFSVTIFEKMPMPQALSETRTRFEENAIGSQLNLFSF
jgi:hypothetical protein